MKVKQNNFKKLLGLVSKHDKWMDETINLIASENRISPNINKIMTSDLGNRVAEGYVGERVFPGIKYYDEIESYGIDLVKDLFKAEFADIRPISGTMANMIIYSAFTKPGDKIASISIQSGAHISMAGYSPKKVFGLEVIELPFDPVKFEIKISESLEILEKERPKMLVLGGSVILFDQPVKQLAAKCKDLGIIVLFDASHVAGLIATGHFPNPFLSGADMMTMTVCKTIPGPQHAFILSKNEFADKIKRSTFPGFLSGHHLHETVASVLVMEEMKLLGKKYSTQVLKNSKALANELDKCGFKILAKEKGFTETHMLLLDISPIMSASDAEKLLEDANILINRNLLPGDTSFKNPSGIRLGTPEMTKLGMKEKEMKLIAKFFKDIFIEKKSVSKVKLEVLKLRKKFKKIKFTYGK